MRNARVGSAQAQHPRRQASEELNDTILMPALQINYAQFTNVNIATNSRSRICTGGLEVL
jgi:hypothetical protein